jgi:hypothetical protein
VWRKAHIAAWPADKPLIVASCWLGACALTSLPGTAQEYCIACIEPTAVYRCVIEDARPGGQSLTRLCVTALTRDGGHGQCSVKGGTVFDCNGPVKRVPWTAQEPGRVTAPANAEREPKPQAGTGNSDQKAGPKTEPKAEPKTMLELAKRANENMQKANEEMKEQAQSAGQSIGKASKKTWDCMLSLFLGC